MARERHAFSPSLSAECQSIFNEGGAIHLLLRYCSWGLFRRINRVNAWRTIVGLTRWLIRKFLVATIGLSRWCDKLKESLLMMPIPFQEMTSSAQNGKNLFFSPLRSSDQQKYWLGIRLTRKTSPCIKSINACKWAPLWKWRYFFVLLALPVPSVFQ